MEICHSLKKSFRYHMPCIVKIIGDCCPWILTINVPVVDMTLGLNNFDVGIIKYKDHWNGWARKSRLLRPNLFFLKYSSTVPLFYTIVQCTPSPKKRSLLPIGKFRRYWQFSLKLPSQLPSLCPCPWISVILPIVRRIVGKRWNTRRVHCNFVRDGNNS
jgi:hypothetical protein